MDAKPWWKSKTIWLNFAAIAAGTAEQVAQTGVLGSAGPMVLQGVGVAGMILRAFTTQPVTVSK